MPRRAAHRGVQIETAAGGRGLRHQLRQDREIPVLQVHPPVHGRFRHDGQCAEREPQRHAPRCSRYAARARQAQLRHLEALVPELRPQHYVLGRQTVPRQRRRLRAQAEHRRGRPPRQVQHARQPARQAPCARHQPVESVEREVPRAHTPAPGGCGREPARHAVARERVRPRVARPLERHVRLQRAGPEPVDEVPDRQLRRRAREGDAQRVAPVALRARPQCAAFERPARIARAARDREDGIRRPGQVPVEREPQAVQIEARGAARPVVAAARGGPAARDLEARRAVARREAPERHALRVARQFERALRDPAELSAAGLGPLQRRPPARLSPAARARHRHHRVAPGGRHLLEPRLPVAHVHDGAHAVEVHSQEEHVPQSHVAQLEVGLRQQRAAHLPEPPRRGPETEPLRRVARERARNPQRAAPALRGPAPFAQHAPDARGPPVRPLVEREPRGLPGALPASAVHGRVEFDAAAAAGHHDLERAGRLRRRVDPDARRVRPPARQLRDPEVPFEARAGRCLTPRPVPHLPRQVAGRPAPKTDRMPEERVPVRDVTAQIEVPRRVHHAPAKRARRGGAVERRDRELAAFPAEAGPDLERDAVPDALGHARTADRAIEAHVEMSAALAGHVEQLVHEHLREPPPAHAIEVHRGEARLRPTMPTARGRELQVGRAQLLEFEARAVAGDEASAQHFEPRGQRTPRPAHALHLDLVLLPQDGAGAKCQAADVMARIRQVHLAVAHRQPHVELPGRAPPRRARAPLRQPELPVPPPRQVDDRPVQPDLERTAVAEGQGPGRVAQRHRASFEQGRARVPTDAQPRLHDGHAPEGVPAHVPHLEHEVAVVGQHAVHDHGEVPGDVLRVPRHPGQSARDQHHDEADGGEHDEPGDASR